MPIRGIPTLDEILKPGRTAVRDQQGIRDGSTKKPKTAAPRQSPNAAPPAPPAPPAPYVPTEAEKLAESRDARFGNDMAWLDELFQEDPLDSIGAARALGTTADEGAQAAQRQGVNQFFDIANGGGATALERARRQKARGESENWLLGQRDADMQNLAERGMSGSGAEVLALLGDRQAAASRLSQADLDTDAALEQRALDALMSGTQLAGDMESRSNSFVQNNASLIDAASARSKQFLQNAYQQTMANRQSWDANMLNQQLQAANAKAGRDQSDNQFGYSTGQSMATGDANAQTQAGQEYRGNTLGAFTGGTPGVLNSAAAAHNAQAGTESALFNTGIETAKTMTEMVAGGAGGGAAGGMGGAGGFWGNMGAQAATKKKVG